MPFDESLAQRIRDGLMRERGVVEKKLFGGIGFLRDGNMFAGVWQDWLIARLGPELGAAALLEPHVKAMDITGKPMKGWLMIAPDGIESDTALHDWLERTLAFVCTLPAK